MSIERFVAAQAATLQQFGVTATSRKVPVTSIASDAHVLVSGDGPPVVMVNGIGVPGAMLAPLVGALTDHTAYVVDLPGYGLTDADRGFPPRLRDGFVAFLADVIAGLGLDAPTIVSNSLGSLIATWLAIDRPGTVSKLIHVGCPALSPGTSAPLPMRMLSARPFAAVIRRVQRPSPRQVEQLSKMVNEHPLPPTIAELILATERLPAFDAMFYPSLHRLIRLRGAHPAMAMTPDELGRIAVPVHLVWGRNDPFGGPDAGRRMVDWIPTATLDVVGGGHAPWLSDPVGVAAAVRSRIGT